MIKSIRRTTVTNYLHPDAISKHISFCIESLRLEGHSYFNLTLVKEKMREVYGYPHHNDKAMNTLVKNAIFLEREKYEEAPGWCNYLFKLKLPEDKKYIEFLRYIKVNLFGID